jgi:predicted ATP-dependent endonuclease of OLD family
MKLCSVEIIDFKSIINEKIDIKGNKICFVGKNESGKSSIIQAISYLNFLEKEIPNNVINKHSKSYPKGLPIIIGLFEVSSKKYLQIIDLIKDNVNPHTSIVIPHKSEKSFIQVKRWGNGLSNISVTMTDMQTYTIDFGKEIENVAKFFNDFFETIYPSIEYFEKEEIIIEPASIEELLEDESKHESFRRLLYIGGCTDLDVLKNDSDDFISTYLSQIEDKFNETFRKHYKQDESIQIKIQTIRNNKLSLIIKDKSKLSFSITERSPGFNYYFSFLVNKLYTKTKNSNRNVILLLDEPGSNLHPNGTKDLLKTFKEISERSQILYTTHNPFLVIRNNLENLLFVEKKELGTKINIKPFLNKYQILRKELGILLNDSFIIGDLNLLVEGNTEKLALHRLFCQDKYKELEWLNIYNADGVTNMPQALNYLGKKNLNLSGIVLLDSDTEGDNVKLNKSFGENIKEKNWELIEINDIYPDKKQRTFEDLFPQDLYIKAYNQYCQSIEKLDYFIKPFTPFELKKEINTPIINEINIHFKSFLEEKTKKSITKQDVISLVLDEIEKLGETDQKKALKDINGIIDRILEHFKNLIKNVNH